MNLNNKIKVVLISNLIIFSALIFSCTKNYEEYNTNPYLPTAQMLEPDNYSTGSNFPIMMQNVFAEGGSSTDQINAYQTAENLAGDVYSGHMGAIGEWESGRNNTNYAFVSGWINTQFQINSRLMAAWIDVKNRSADSALVAVARIIKITGMHRATDMYGPIPYSSIETGTLNPSFDAQDKMYYSFIAELTRAVNTLYDFATKNPTAKPLLKYDLVFGGDYSKWAKFANSLKLRLAMRMVYADPGKAKQFAEEAINSPIGVMTTKADNAALWNALPNIFYRNPLRMITEDYNDIRMGASMQSILSGYADPRMNMYFRPAKLASNAGQFIGVRNGINVVKSRYTDFSLLNVTDNTPIPWMTAAEVYFLRAEGAIRGWSMGGTAQSLYESGIKASFDETGATLPSTYLSNSTAKPANYVDASSSTYNIAATSTITIAWSETATFEQKLERIVTQKWIALYPNGQEAWTEFRRTGYPKIFPVAVNYSSGGSVNTAAQVRRLPYPLAQYQGNAAEVARGVQLLGGADNGGTKLWWDKKP